MNDLEQEIAIAKICGWTHTKTVHNPGPSAYGRHPIHTAGVDWDLPLPDYLNDLNAMHEAEKVLTSEMEKEYSFQIEAVCCPREYGWHATAAQRAEAFLKTLNLWKP